MISEQPVIGLLEVELRATPTGFLLGQSHLDVDHLGDANEPIAWDAYTCETVAVSAQRGGKRAGVVNTIDVGVLNVSLKNAADPTTTPNAVPNAPVRIRAKGNDRPIFTGVISDIDMTHTFDKKTGKKTTVVNFSVVDGVQAHANTTRYGAIAPDGFERWESRIQRLAESSTAPINPPVVDDPVVRYFL